MALAPPRRRVRHPVRHGEVPFRIGRSWHRLKRASIRYVQDAATDPKPPPARRRGSRLVMLAVIAAGLVVAAAFAFAVTALRPHQSQPSPPRVSGMPASVPASLVNLMALTPVPEQAAPGFTLTDQAGHTLSLDSFRGRAVVLEFIDPHCTDICPIVSRSSSPPTAIWGPRRRTWCSSR